MPEPSYDPSREIQYNPGTAKRLIYQIQRGRVKFNDLGPEDKLIIQKWLVYNTPPSVAQRQGIPSPEEWEKSNPQLPEKPDADPLLTQLAKSFGRGAASTATFEQWQPYHEAKTTPQALSEMAGGLVPFLVASILTEGTGGVAEGAAGASRLSGLARMLSLGGKAEEAASTSGITALRALAPTIRGVTMGAEYGTAAEGLNALRRVIEGQPVEPGERLKGVASRAGQWGALGGLLSAGRSKNILKGIPEALKPEGATLAGKTGVILPTELQGGLFPKRAPRTAPTRPTGRQGVTALTVVPKGTPKPKGPTTPTSKAGVDKVLAQVEKIVEAGQIPPSIDQRIAKMPRKGGGVLLSKNKITRSPRSTGKKKSRVVPIQHPNADPNL